MMAEENAREAHEVEEEHVRAMTPSQSIALTSHDALAAMLWPAHTVVVTLHTSERPSCLPGGVVHIGAAFDDRADFDDVAMTRRLDRLCAYTWAADAARVEKAFRIILKDPAVKAILVNIFGGIVRCDRVAQGVVDAYRNMGNIDVPIIVRLQGTNAEEAKRLIDESGLEVKSAILLKEAAEAVAEVLA